MKDAVMFSPLALSVQINVRLSFNKRGEQVETDCIL